MKSSDKNLVHWRREWQPTPVFLPGEPQEQYEKSKRYGRKMSPSGWKESSYAPREEWRAVTNLSRKKEASGPQRKGCSAVNISDG